MDAALPLVTLLTSRDTDTAQQGVELLRSLRDPALLAHLAGGCGVSSAGVLTAGPHLSDVRDQHREWCVLQVLAMTGGLEDITVLELTDWLDAPLLALLAQLSRPITLRLRTDLEVFSTAALAALPDTVHFLDARAFDSLPRDAVGDLRAALPDCCVLLIGEELVWDAPEAPLPPGVEVRPFCLPYDWEGRCDERTSLTLVLTPEGRDPTVDRGAFVWFTEEESNYGSHRTRAAGTYRLDRARQEMTLTLTEEATHQRLRCSQEPCPAAVNYMSFSQRIRCDHPDCGRLPPGWGDPRAVRRSEVLTLSRAYERFELEGAALFVSDAG